MNRQVCKYRIIRFLPYTEIGEFANIGIVLYVPASQRLVYKTLSPDQHDRITHFFSPMNKALFCNTIRIIQAELERVKKLLEQTAPIEVDLYQELTRPREDIIRYSENRVLYSTDHEQTVARLFERYVHRGFTE